MEKGIDKAAERALEKYPIEMYEDVGWRCADKNEYKRQYFVEGYHQAEKDLELTWEDISIIKEILCGIVGYPLVTDKEICTEVLNRFKKGKG